MKMTSFQPLLLLFFLLLSASAGYAQQAPPPPAPDTSDALKPPPPISANAPHAAEIREARTAAEAWIQLLDAGRFDQAYEQMGQAARTQISQDEWKGRLKDARSHSGKLESRIFQSTDYTTTLKNAPAGEYVILQYLCTFASHNTALETIVMTKDNIGWHVAGFSVA